MADSILTVPAQIESVATRADRTTKIVVGTATEIDPIEMTLLFEMNQKQGWFGFSERSIVEQDMVNLPDIPAAIESNKSPAQRLRSRMFVCYREVYKKEEGFNAWYEDQLERIGKRYLDKIEQ